MSRTKYEIVCINCGRKKITEKKIQKFCCHECSIEYRMKQKRKVINGIVYKKCSICEEFYPMTNEYFIKSKKGDGFHCNCKKCENKKNRIRYKTDEAYRKKCNSVDTEKKKLRRHNYYIKNRKKEIDRAKKEFVKTLKDAETMKPKTNAEINAMVDKLSGSLNKLSVKATVAQINIIKDLQNKLEIMKKEDFSTENQKVIIQTIDEVKEALKNTNLSQKDAEDLIIKANKVLNLKPEESNGEIDNDKPSHNDGTNDGIDNHKPSNNNGTIGGIDNEKPSNNVNNGTVIVNPSEKPNSNTPTTGADAQTGTFAGIMLLGGIGAWLASRKRKEEQK